jgi:hypothetical protein
MFCYSCRKFIPKDIACAQFWKGKAKCCQEDAPDDGDLTEQPKEEEGREPPKD